MAPSNACSVRRRSGVRRCGPACRPPSACPHSFRTIPSGRDSWSLGKVKATEAWSVTTGAAETVVAVLDTGVDLGHPDLQGAFVAGYDTVNEDADPSDDHGHGTMVAGVIAARGNNGIGVAGACWRCSLMPVKVISANGQRKRLRHRGGDPLGDGARGAGDQHELHAERGRRLDRGGRRAGPSAGGRARCRGREQRHHGRHLPRGVPGVVSVAATDAADARYAWSTFGSWVQLAAPGCNMATAPGGGYGDFCGTSSASAFVSGLAGLARSVAGQLSPDAISQVLSSTAAPVGDFVSTGRVDAAATIASLRTP